MAIRTRGSSMWPHRARTLRGSLGEEQRQDQDVVDVGDGEQPGGLPDDAQVHEWMASPSMRLSW
nr:hypothetical protein OH837_09390 [Streptomyces canus]